MDTKDPSLRQGRKCFLHLDCERQKGRIMIEIKRWRAEKLEESTVVAVASASLHAIFISLQAFLKGVRSSQAGSSQHAINELCATAVVKLMWTN